MPNIKVERSYYENGQIRGECSLEDGCLVGTTRLWHENGVLKWECPFDKGLEHGGVRQWNQDGKLLGEFCMEHGTGVSKSWFENGQIESESHSIAGKLCGRFRSWYEDGEIVSTEYHVANKKVSKKKYDEACKNDPTLPRYEKDNLKPNLELPSTKDRKRKTPISQEERDKHDKFMAERRADPNQAEVRQWLAGDENRKLGEMGPEESREVIEEGYKAGATLITAVEIDGETTNCLIVGLPAKGVKRKRVFEWNKELAQSSGFDPDEDWGQNELFVYFS